MPKTILIAEDLASSRIMLEALLKKQGHRTIGVDGGYKCIQTAQNQKVDLILLDIVMPDLSGIDVCKRLRNNPSTSSTPIIFVTSATDDSTLSKAFDAGANDYIRKPVNNIELVKRVQAAFDHELLQTKQNEEVQLRNLLAMNGTICHELNQPLQYLSGMLEVFEDDVEKGSGAFNRVKKMQIQIKRMAEITQKLQRITKIESTNYVGASRILKLD